MHLYAADPLSGLPVDSRAFRQRAPHTWLSEDPDTATAQTVQEMCRQIHQAAKDPLVRQLAINAVRNFRGGPAWAGTGIDAFSNPQCMAESCWWWCKHFLRFKHHGSMFEAWSADLGDPRTKLQLLIAPDVLVRMRRMEGDCAIYTMMLCAMLEALGIRWEIVTLAVDEMQPEIFSHVFARAVLPAGRESLDASHGSYPGWQVPARDIHREWTFDSNGGRVQGGGRFTGLHGYRRRLGMGDVCNPADADYDPNFCASQGGGSTGGYVNPTQVYGPDLGYQGNWSTSSGSPYSGPVYTAPSQSNSAQWATFATNALRSGLTLAEINAIQPGTVVGANGQILRQNPGYAVGTPTGALNLGSGISTTTLLLGGVLIFGLFAFMGKRG